jgi:hypothetical protein
MALAAPKGPISPSIADRFSVDDFMDMIGLQTDEEQASLLQRVAAARESKVGFTYCCKCGARESEVFAARPLISSRGEVTMQWTLDADPLLKKKQVVAWLDLAVAST